MKKQNKKPKKKKNKIDKYQRIINKSEKSINNYRKSGKNNKYDILFEKILLNTNKLWFPNKENKLNDTIKNINGKGKGKRKGKEYSSHSWFNITEYIPNNANDDFSLNMSSQKVDQLIKCQKIKIYPNDNQKMLLLNWMKSYIHMYNKTLKTIKNFRFNKEKIILNWRKLRNLYLNDEKKNIIKKSQLKNIKNNTRVNTHILDFAIQDACSKVKSSISSLMNGNIKKFRIRYYKQSKESKILKIEKAFINTNKNTFCSSVFKDSFKFNDNFNLKEVHSDFLIHYNKNKDEFLLLNPIKINQMDKDDSKKSSCSLDPGIKTFLTLFSNNKCVNIADNLKEKIMKNYHHIDRMNNCDKRQSVKEKIKKKYQLKIKNLIDDLHWKTINYLTKNFNNILIGNLSTKGIIKNKSNNNLDRRNKIGAQYMSLFKFKERLKYKCLRINVGYMEIDEAYTTMSCSKCGYQNDVGLKREIKCDFCNLKINRDFNGARNIMLRGIN